MTIKMAANRPNLRTLDLRLAADKPVFSGVSVNFAVRKRLLLVQSAFPKFDLLLDSLWVG